MHYGPSAMDIRQLQYLAALAREKHFTRAAKACNVTQPTLSGRIRQLEQELGVPIVERGQRFHGLTPEGERVLKWAHTILDNWQAMQQELASIKGRKEQLTGRLVIGAVPSALPMAPSALLDEYPITSAPSPSLQGLYSAIGAHGHPPALLSVGPRA